MKESKSSQGIIRNRNMSLAERRAWTIPPDDLPADAMIDSGRRQNWEVQHSVTIDLMYNNLTTDTGHDVNNKPW
ncbi:MAG: hypothetical protein WCS17_10435 [Prevotella sp.]